MKTGFNEAILAGYRAAVSIIKAIFTGTGHADGGIEVVEHASRSLHDAQGSGTSQGI